jgi:TAT (twin-arginine translocation) pathway-exported protein
MPDTHISRRNILKGAGVAGAAGLAALAPSGILARAEEGDNDNALEGAWRGTATVTGLGSFGTLLSFAAGGSLVHSVSLDLQNISPNNNLSTPSYGAWKRTGSGKYAVKFNFFTFDAQTNPSGSGEVKEQLSVHGDDLTGTLTVTFFDTAGNVVPPSAIPGTIKALRIEAD